MIVVNIIAILIPATGRLVQTDREADGIRVDIFLMLSVGLELEMSVIIVAVSSIL